jgi:hypothetical protein
MPFDPEQEISEELQRELNTGKIISQIAPRVPKNGTNRILTAIERLGALSTYPPCLVCAQPAAYDSVYCSSECYDGWLKIHRSEVPENKVWRKTSDIPSRGPWGTEESERSEDSDDTTQDKIVVFDDKENSDAVVVAKQTRLRSPRTQLQHLINQIDDSLEKMKDGDKAKLLLKKADILMMLLENKTWEASRSVDERR